jgi:glycosyltransferase involved in cell wall biosynthesis
MNIPQLHEQNYKPKISVIIPTFNREKTITYCLNSVSNQTYDNIEIIVIDDCSTDGTVDIVNSYSDRRINCIALKRNKGAQAARNRGIIEANGDWIAFQDSDDEWIKKKLEMQINVLKEENFNPWTVIHCAGIRYDYKKKIKVFNDNIIKQGKGSYLELFINPPPMFQSILVSKTALRKIGYLDEDVLAHQEWDTSIRLAKYCRFVYIKEPLFIYHRDIKESISKDIKKDIEARYYILKKFESEIKEVEGLPKWKMLIKHEMHRCLDFGLWSEYDWYSITYFSTRENDIRSIYLKLCRLIHLKPTNWLYKLLKICRNTLLSQRFWVKVP